MDQNLTDLELFYSKLRLMRYPMYTSYIIFGAPAILTNAIIIIVLFGDKSLLKKSALIVGLAGANLFSGIHAFGYGVYRLPLVKSNTIELPASAWLCMASMIPTCMILGYGLPAAIQFVIGLERLVAIGAFHWYKIYWSNKKAWYTVAIVYAVMICVWVAPEWYKVFSKYRLVTKECSSAAVIDPHAFNFLVYFVIGAGSLGVVCICVAVIIGRCRISKLSLEDVTQFKNQLRFCKIMLVVALADFIFVVVPNMLWVLSNYLPRNLAAVVITSSAVIYCINSTTNVFIYLGMNRNFRRVASTKLRIFIQFIWCPFNKIAPFNAT